jgi:NHLM bacteriocin system secretion protein
MMIFRPQALEKVSDPDQLDQTLAIVRPRHVLAIGVVTAIVLAGLVWSFYATAPVIVGGRGVLLSTAGVATVAAQGGGQIEQVLASPGERIERGQPLFRVLQPERLDALHSAEAEAEDVGLRYQVLETEYAAQDRMQQDLMERLRAAIVERTDNLASQRAILIERRKAEGALREKGMISAMNAFETERLLAQVENELATARARINELSLEQEQGAAQRHQELAQLRIQLQNLRRRANNLRREYERDQTIFAAASGTLAEVAVDLNDFVSAGQVVARLVVGESQAASLNAIAYLPAADGKRVKSGMTVRVAPSTIKVERDGYILGRVTRVAELPASREGMMRRLKNSVLTDELLRMGTPFEIEVQLQHDPNTPSGYAWTSGTGPDIRVEPGTLARTEVVVERIHLISLLFPAMEYVYGWARAL